MCSPVQIRVRDGAVLAELSITIAPMVLFPIMHRCKGLEFPLVAIPGVGRGGTGEALAEDEARLLYVAMTRATRELVVAGA